jgi:hypothetical protein
MGVGAPRAHEGLLRKYTTTFQETLGIGIGIGIAIETDADPNPDAQAPKPQSIFMHLGAPEVHGSLVR